MDTNTIAAMIQQAMDAGTPAFVADRPDHDMRYAVNPAKAEALGWRPTITLAQGLADTISWYRDNQAWWRAIKDGPDFRHFKWD